MKPTYALAALCALFAVAACRPPIAEPTLPAHPGFDTWRYPGTETMRAWREASPYRWVGYYLESPCHRSDSFMGRRAELEGMGWGMAVLYVGQQTWEGVEALEEEPEEIICSRTLLTAEQGRLDAQDAASTMAAEGFPPGSTVFLNVERMETVTDSMATYYRSWMRTVLEDGRFVPGTYSHRRNAEALFALAVQEYARGGHEGRPRFWVAGGQDFALDVVPAAVGLPFTEIWQGAIDVEREWGGTRLRIDENVATRRDPSAPHEPEPAARRQASD